MAIYLYATLSVISRTTTILNDDSISENEKEYVLNLSKYSCEDCKNKFYKNHNEMSDNVDKVVKDISDMIVEKEEFGIDIINY